MKNVFRRIGKSRPRMHIAWTGPLSCCGRWNQLKAKPLWNIKSFLSDIAPQLPSLQSLYSVLSEFVVIFSCSLCIAFSHNGGDYRKYTVACKVRPSAHHRNTALKAQMLFGKTIISRIKLKQLRDIYYFLLKKNVFWWNCFIFLDIN